MTSEFVNIPTEEVARQAIHSLRGYIYQVYQSLSAWLAINEEEVLLLEVAEDYAVVAQQALTATQVKDTAASGSVTLRTNSIKNAIESFWTFQKANPTKKVVLNYLTTSTIGREQNIAFPNNDPGLIYWRKVAREGVEVEPLRSFLISLDLSVELIDFIKTASSQELKEQLLRRIHWQCGAKDINTLSQTILDRLVYTGEKMGFAPSDSEAVRDALVLEILQVIVQSGERNLNRADLLRIIEKKISISMPLSAVRQAFQAERQNGPILANLQYSTSLLNERNIPISKTVSKRELVVKNLSSKLINNGCLWLHGSSGLGKTLLARIISKFSNLDWWLLPLRDYTSTEIEHKLREAVISIDMSRLGGIILDDLPTECNPAVRLRISILVDEIRRNDGLVIVTSMRQPSQTLSACFGEQGIEPERVPYFSIPEVEELVKLADGEPHTWANIIHSFCGAGHPQLVDARIKGLKSRGWPEQELLSGLPNFGKLEDVEDEKAEVRRRLVLELPENARDFLDRLSLVIGDFDKELAFAVAELSPEITRPGELFELLLGPWLEIHGPDRYSISPLVYDSGRNNLTNTFQKNISIKVIENLLSRNPIPGDFLSKLSTHALISRHEQALTLVTYIANMAQGEDLKNLANELSFWVYFDTKILPFPENPNISLMLRLTQFTIAATLKRTEYLQSIFMSLLEEARQLDKKELSNHSVIMVIGKGMIEPQLHLEPSIVLSLIREFTDIISGDSQAAKFAQFLPPIREGIAGWTIPQFFFVTHATVLHGLKELVCLFELLNTMPKDERDSLLSGLNNGLPVASKLIINSSWLFEVKNGTLDGNKAADTFLSLFNTAYQWKNSDLAIECLCARAVMLNEYAEKPDLALEVLEEAEKLYPSDARIIRERAKIHYQQKDHEKSLKVFETIEISSFGDNVDRAFALRQAAISAAENKDLQKALTYFQQAYKEARESVGTLKHMTAGLLADCAVMEFQLGNKSSALQFMKQAIIEAESIGNSDEKRDKYCSIILGHTIFWMRSKKDPDQDMEFQVTPGCCSNPDPPEEILKKPLAPAMMLWYLLAQLEAGLELDENIRQELRKRTVTQGILTCEVSLNMTTMKSIILSGDTIRFYEYLPNFACIQQFTKDNSEQFKLENPFIPSYLPIPPPVKENWKNEYFQQAVKEALISFAVHAVYNNKHSIFYELIETADKLVEDGREFVTSFLASLLEQPMKNPCLSGRAGSSLDILMKQTHPSEQFLASFYLFNFMAYSVCRSIVEDQAAELLVSKWKKIITDQKFLLNNPKNNVPNIEAVLAGTSKGLNKIAKLILSTQPTIDLELNRDSLQLLQQAIDSNV